MEYKPLFVTNADYKRISPAARDDAKLCGYVFISVPDPSGITTVSDFKISESGVMRAAGIAIQTSQNAMQSFGRALGEMLEQGGKS